MPRQRRDVPWLDQHNNGVWYAFKYDPTRRRTIRESLETKDSMEAQLRFAQLLTHGFRGARSGGHAGLTVTQALDSYIEEHARVKLKGTSDERQATAAKRLKAFFKETPLSDVDVPLSRAYLQARLSGAIDAGEGRGNRKCHSPSTVRRELAVLVAAANHAAKLKRVGPKASPPTPMPEVELPAEPPPRRVRWLTKQQITHIFAAADEKVLLANRTLAEKAAAKRRPAEYYLRARDNAEYLAAFCRIAYYTAARRNSVEKMLKSQVDLAHGILHLDPEGARQSNKRRPTVPIYPEIRPWLERLMNKSTNEYLFGGIPDFYRPFAELAADVGITAWPHMLRHSRATHMLMDGEDPYKVARLLGDNLGTLLNVYAHATVDYLNTNSTLEEAG